MQLNKAVEVFLSRALHRTNVRDTGIVDQDLKALLAEQFLELSVHFRLVRHIATVGAGSATSGINLLTGCSGSRFVDIEDMNYRAALCEFQRDGLSNATAAAGDNCHPAVETEIPSAGISFGHRETPRFQGMKSS
jgi:hypothetical protein